MQSLWQVSRRPTKDARERVLAGGFSRQSIFLLPHFNALRFTYLCFLWDRSWIPNDFDWFLGSGRYRALIGYTLSALATWLMGRGSAKELLDTFGT